MRAYIAVVFAKAVRVINMHGIEIFIRFFNNFIRTVFDAQIAVIALIYKPFFAYGTRRQNDVFKLVCNFIF